MTSIDGAIAATGHGLRIRPGHALIGVVFMRWLAGIGENAGIAGLSENAALAALAALALIFLVRMQMARDAGLLLAGLAAWIAAGLLSAAANGQLANGDGLELIALLAFYGLVANSARLDLRGAAGLAALNRLTVAFLVAGAALAIWQIAVGQAFHAPARPDLARAQGSDVHPVSFGIQLVIALAALEVLRLKRGARFGALHACLAAAGLVALYLTFARTAWAMAAITLTWALLAGRRFHLQAAGLAVLAGAAALSAANARFGDLASLPLFLAQFDAGNIVFDHRFVDNSVSWRIVNWGMGLEQALQAPWLGHGPGQSAAASAFNLEMHNIALELFFECGLAGLAALALVLAGLVRLHRTLPRAGPRDRRAARIVSGLGVALLLAVMVSTSLVDQLMTITLYLLLLGISQVPARGC